MIVSVPCPSGYDSTSDPLQLTPGRCRQLVNLQTDRAGALRGVANVFNVIRDGSSSTNPYGSDAGPFGFPLLPSPVDGVGYYYRTPVTNVGPLAVNQGPYIGRGDYSVPTQLMAVIQGYLWLSQLPVGYAAGYFTGPTPYPPGIPYNQFRGYIASSGRVLFQTGKRARFASFKDEVIIVQDGGIPPVRYSGGAGIAGVPGASISGYDLLGLPAPSAPNAVAHADAASVLNGDYNYIITIVDEKNRESSPSSPTTVTTATGVTDAIIDPGTANDTLIIGNAFGSIVGINSWNLYRNLQGEFDTYYRVASNLQGGTTHVDNLPDSFVQGEPLMPNFGENDQPNAASLVEVHKDYVFLNDATNPSILRVSNQGSATQYCSFPTIATDGGFLQLIADQGDEITGLRSFGDVMLIATRRHVKVLYGNSFPVAGVGGDFAIYPLFDTGCIAPDTFVRCEENIMYLGPDGVYMANYQSAPNVPKVSKEIEADLLAQSRLDLENAVAWYFQKCYWLWISNIIFVYSFDNPGWSQVILS